ncbi:phosphohistidine phosphatase [Toxoplasma gondii ME49]|uniref:Phosphohistidine phosphatase n=3 Tax=Toxoplasma gondii TaxID=5811 RepID=A0A2G8XVB7_TOXGO|nr:phosphohistidine phosphatase [Toxoplasma gondii ME49]EPT32101.1 phosphohistidine phosphatase [Toxoplasma gondii ME49]KYF42541.1 phosphohistidine phosphatase [Toxoplasma gondii ARI]PIL98967.1 phosphohistidine phosphatase [Toxoplasma gondii COUG]|eukprot:XP_002370082.2 phosphohistidine phosphatase [Toxoplasma gondii ME49]
MPGGRGFCGSDAGLFGLLAFQSTRIRRLPLSKHYHARVLVSTTPASFLLVPRGHHTVLVTEPKRRTWVRDPRTESASGPSPVVDGPKFAFKGGISSLTRVRSFRIFAESHAAGGKPTHPFFYPAPLRLRSLLRCGAALCYFSSRPASPFPSLEVKMPSLVSGRHRTPAELQAALKVVNDQLADANDVERPALELVAQKLTEELVEVECELAQQKGSSGGPAGSSGDSGSYQTSEKLQQASVSCASHPSGDSSGKPAADADEDVVSFLTALPKVCVEEGVQKYVLLRVDPERNEGKRLKTAIYLVRGNPQAEYHYQCALDTMKELESKGLVAEVQGGGRIECRMNDRQIEIYGHSYQYGRADHSITAQLIKQFFGNDFQVSWGDYGY